MDDGVSKPPRSDASALDEAWKQDVLLSGARNAFHGDCRGVEVVRDRLRRADLTASELAATAEWFVEQLAAEADADVADEIILRVYTILGDALWTLALRFVLDGTTRGAFIRLLDGLSLDLSSTVNLQVASHEEACANAARNTLLAISVETATSADVYDLCLLFQIRVPPAPPAQVETLVCYLRAWMAHHVQPGVPLSLMAQDGGKSPLEALQRMGTLMNQPVINEHVLVESTVEWVIDYVIACQPAASQDARHLARGAVVFFRRMVMNRAEGGDVEISRRLLRATPRVVETLFMLIPMSTALVIMTRWTISGLFDDSTVDSVTLL